MDMANMCGTPHVDRTKENFITINGMDMEFIDGILTEPTPNNRRIRVVSYKGNDKGMGRIKRLYSSILENGGPENIMDME